MMQDGAGQHWLDTRWKTGVLALWAALAVILLFFRLPEIDALVLVDTDDNLRLAQVRAWLAGQGWSDLTQYRLAPPVGADIHWSRIPDIPIAALILLLTPVLGTALAEQWAVAIAPLFPLAIAMVALAIIARRLVDPRVWPLAVMIALASGYLLPMWTPLRIDHHGWQLAMLVVALTGLTDEKARRGGLMSGIATAISFAIGLEMLAFLGLIGAAHALFWIYERQEASRLAAYGVSLGGGTAFGFLLFASTANRAPVCDALSPVWLSVMAAAGALLVVLALLNPQGWRARFGFAAIAAIVLALGFALLWPDCLGRPEGVSAELDTLWLSNVSEARPLYLQGWRKVLTMVALPLAGFSGYVLALRSSWRTPLFRVWLACAAFALAGFALLFWQVRILPAAHILAVPGAVALGGPMLRESRASASLLMRVVGPLVSIFIMTGLWTAVPLTLFPQTPDTVKEARAENAKICTTREALAPIAVLPPGTVLTPVDFGPKLIVTTPHMAIAGPYHRNGTAILDVIQAFRGGMARARETVDRYDVDYVLLCPGMAEEGIYRRGGDDTFFAALNAGNPPAWLEPVRLPENSPFRMWRVR